MKKETKQHKGQPEDVVVIDDNDGDDDVALKKTPAKASSAKKKMASSSSSSPSKNVEKRKREPEFSYDDVSESAVRECYEKLLETKKFTRKMMS